MYTNWPYQSSNTAWLPKPPESLPSLGSGHLLGSPLLPAHTISPPGNRQRALKPCCCVQLDGFSSLLSQAEPSLSLQVASKTYLTWPLPPPLTSWCIIFFLCSCASHTGPMLAVASIPASVFYTCYSPLAMFSGR
jgi:hypothetical protein